MILRIFCESSLTVRHLLPKQDHVGSTPISRSAGVIFGMICRHGPNDSSCSSHRDYVDPYPDPVPKYISPGTYGVETPDSKNYSIEEATRVGAHLVLKVKYPNCRRCAYEGNKILVLLNVSELQVLKWKEIDPHFRDPKVLVDATRAPSPSARFPASKDGWADALVYARGKS